ncbi:MAG: PQQ-binding-like beta-propeller repeat protein, partial [Candidatus Eisenbacteria bacterium]
MRSKCALLLLALFAFFPPAAHAQTRDPDFPYADNDVLAFALHGDTLLVGGRFRNLGPNSGAFVGVDVTTGRAQSRWPRVFGKVDACISDGSGGWFIGGLFNAVAGVRRVNLAHIRADGTLDDLNPAPDGEVRALAYGAGVLYAGGDFTSVGGVARNRLAAMNVATGLVTPWNPDATDAVNAMLLHGGDLLVGGAFLQVGGQINAGIAALDLATGASRPWSPSVVPGTVVFAMAARNDTLLVGGAFNSMGNQPRSNLAMLSTSAATALAWNPSADGTVYALALSGGTVYAGGEYFHSGGQARTRLAALDLASGTPAAWGPPMNQQVRSILVSGATVYVGGGFANLLSAPHYQSLVALSAATGQVSGPEMNTNSTVHALAIANGTLFVGGDFESCPVKIRYGIGAIDLKTEQVLDWYPNPNLLANVNALVSVGDTLYMGGNFSQMGGQTRNGLAAVSLTTGLATPFAASESGVINTLAMNRDTLYVSGSFSSYGGQPRQDAAALNVHTGLVTGWAPDPGGFFTSIVPESNAVYVAGFFGSLGGYPHRGPAALDPATGGELWPMSGDDNAFALAKDGNTLYVGGVFQNLEGQDRGALGAYNVTTQLLLPWNPGTLASLTNASVNALALGSGKLYAGGEFLNAGGQGRLALAAFDRTFGDLQPWAPLPDGPVVGSLIEKEGVVYAGVQGSLSSPLQSFMPEITSFPAVTVVAPAPGTTLNTGSTYRLAWNASASAPGIQSVDVYLSRTGAAGPWKLLAAGAPNTGGYDWLVAGPNAIGTCFLRVDARDWQGRVVSHVSPAGFSIGT